MPKLIQTQKELAEKLGRNRRYVHDMLRGGFKFPAYLHDAVNFLRKNPHPSKFRKKG